MSSGGGCGDFIGGGGGGGGGNFSTGSITTDCGRGAGAGRVSITSAFGDHGNGGIVVPPSAPPYASSVARICLFATAPGEAFGRKNMPFGFGGASSRICPGGFGGAFGNGEAFGGTLARA